MTNLLFILLKNIYWKCDFFWHVGYFSMFTGLVIFKWGWLFLSWLLDWIVMLFCSQCDICINTYEISLTFSFTLPVWHAGVTCHFSPLSEMPYRGKMEWNFIPFYLTRVKWNGQTIPDYQLPVQDCPTCHFPMQKCCFLLVMDKYIANLCHTGYHTCYHTNEL